VIIKTIKNEKELADLVCEFHNHLTRCNYVLPGENKVYIIQDGTWGKILPHSIMGTNCLIFSLADLAGVLGRGENLLDYMNEGSLSIERKT